MPVPQTAAAAAQAPAAAGAVQPTLAEQLTSFVRTAWDHLLQLDAGEASLNLLLTAAVALIAFGLVWVLRRLFDRWCAGFIAIPGQPAPTRAAPKAAGVTWGLLRLLILAGA